MGWTKWRKLAVGNRWHDDIFDWNGPACYELAQVRQQRRVLTGEWPIGFDGERFVVESACSEDLPY
jgi:hypothetical protein